MTISNDGVRIWLYGAMLTLLQMPVSELGNLNLNHPGQVPMHMPVEAPHLFDPNYQIDHCNPPPQYSEPPQTYAEENMIRYDVSGEWTTAFDLFDSQPPRRRAEVARAKGKPHTLVIVSFNLIRSISAIRQTTPHLIIARHVCSGRCTAC